jgi:cytochrome P450
MLFCNSFITRSERFFRNASQFDPSRWEKEEITCTHPYAALPFGFGPRACIGRRIAEQEIYLTLIKLVQTFKIVYNDESALGLKTGLIASPDRPLNLTFQRR